MFHSLGGLNLSEYLFLLASKTLLFSTIYNTFIRIYYSTTRYEGWVGSPNNYYYIVGYE